MSDARQITAELRGHWFGNYGVAFCPAHDNSRTPALSLKNTTDGHLLAYCHAGCNFFEVRAALAKLGLLPEHTAAPLRHREPKSRLAWTSAQRATTKRKAERAMGLWNAAQTTADSLAMRYLQSRGISHGLPPTLRSLHNCRHPCGQRIPTLLARVDGAASFAVHRTFLTADGNSKTHLHPAKAMLGSCKGGAVHLSDIGFHNAGGPLIVTEGIENGLSLLSGLLDFPATVWAALSTSGIVSLNLPSKPGHLIIAADGDPAGRRAAQRLSMRANQIGWRTSYLTPPTDQDWNDVLLQQRGMK